MEKMMLTQSSRMESGREVSGERGTPKNITQAQEASEGVTAIDGWPPRNIGMRTRGQFLSCRPVDTADDSQKVM